MVNQAHEPVCKSYVWLPDDQYFRKQQASIVQSRMTAWFFRDQTNRTGKMPLPRCLLQSVLITDPPQIAKRQDEPSLNTKAVLNCRLRLGRQVKRLDHKISLMTGLPLPHDQFLLNFFKKKLAPSSTCNADTARDSTANRL